MYQKIPQGTFKQQETVGEGMSMCMLMHIHTLHSTSVGKVRVFMCNITQKTPGSYIKFSLGHKLGPVVTLSGRVPNEIDHLGSYRAMVSTEDRPFWSICRAGAAHGSGWETCWSGHQSDLRWTPVNCNWLHALSSLQFFWSFHQIVFFFFFPLIFCCV